MGKWFAQNSSMARKLRVAYAGAIYHVTLRGVERRELFADSADRERMLEQLAHGVELDGVRLYLFCLMTNHVHLLVETPRANLSQFMHRLETGYTVYFNMRHRRAGHLMQGRFVAVLVEGDEYLLKLSRYIHLNPVQVGTVRQKQLRERIKILRRYRWSSYQGYIGRAKRHELVTYGPILDLVSNRVHGGARAYRRFVESGLVESDDEFKQVMEESSLSLGDEEFRERIRDMYLDMVQARKRPEDVSLRAAHRRLVPEVIRKEVLINLGISADALAQRRRGSWGRPVFARMLCVYGGLSQREVAELLGIKTGAAVSLQLLRLKQKTEVDRSLRRQVAAIETKLQKQIKRSSVN